MDILRKYLPDRAVYPCFELIKRYQVHLKIVNPRKSRYGDYCRLDSGQHQITINAGRNKYAFLVTFIHEMAHLAAYELYGRNIKPHGKEWKHTFSHMMAPFLNETIFPKALLPILKNYFSNPKASSDTDAMLSVALKQYDFPSEKVYLFQLLEGDKFRIDSGRVFIRGKKQIKRYLCQEVSTLRWYIFQPNTPVEPI